MRKTTIAALLCAFLASLAGCSLVSDKTKTNRKEQKRQVKVLGVPVWKSEKPAAPPAP